MYAFAVYSAGLDAVSSDYFVSARVPIHTQDISADFPAAKDLFDKASSILGYDLLEVCTEGNAAGCCAPDFPCSLSNAAPLHQFDSAVQAPRRSWTPPSSANQPYM